MAKQKGASPKGSPAPTTRKKGAPVVGTIKGKAEALSKSKAAVKGPPKRLSQEEIDAQKNANPKAKKGKINEAVKGGKNGARNAGGRKGAPKKNMSAGKKKKGSTRKKQKGTFDKILNALGIGVGIVNLRDPKALETADMLDLTQSHLRKMRYKFDEIDIDGSGSIDAEEFFETLDMARSPFTDRLFAMIDLDANGSIDFDEFIRVVTTYCMFTKDEILRFCFECFDVDSSGTIDEKEFVELCKTVNNANPTFPGNFKKALEQFDVNDDGLIDYSEFLEIEKRFPMVLFPAFQLQDRMQDKSLGLNSWLQVIKNYNRALRVEEYRASHGGKAPPDSFSARMGKLFCPCLYRTNVKVKAAASG
jgi:Ca2+-binding EF-hand superfamily protein